MGAKVKKNTLFLYRHLWQCVCLFSLEIFPTAVFDRAYARTDTHVHTSKSFLVKVIPLLHVVLYNARTNVLLLGYNKASSEPAQFDCFKALINIAELAPIV